MAKKSAIIKVETEQHIKMLVDEAIELYTGNYGEVIKRAIDGTLYIKKYKKANDLLSELGKIASMEELQDSIDSAEIKVIKANIRRLKDYVYPVRIASEKLKRNLTQSLQGFFGSGPLITDSRIVYSVILLKLIDIEMKKAERVAKSSGKSVVEIARNEILDKALASCTMYEGADFKALKPYIDNALTTLENAKYIRQIDDIYRMNKFALYAITQLEELRRKGQESFNTTINQVGEEYKERHISFVESFIRDDFNPLIDKSIASVMAIIYDKNLSLEQSLKKIEVETKNAIQAVTQYVSLGGPLLLSINQFTVSLNEYLNKYTQAISDENIASIVKIITDGRTRLTDTTAFKDVYSGKGAEVEGQPQPKAEILDLLGDEELLKTMFGKILRFPNSISDRFHAEVDSVSNENLAEELTKITTKYNNEINAWLESFDSDYSAVVEGYRRFVLYRERIENLSKGSRIANAVYIQKFNPIGRSSGLPYFSEKQLELLKKAMLQTMDFFDGEEKAQWDKNLAVTFAYSVERYFRELSIGRDVESVSQHLDMQNEETMIAKVLKPITQLTEEQVLDNDVLTNKLSGSEDLLALAKNPRCSERLRAVMDYTQIELMLSAFSLLEELHKMNGDEDDYTAKVQLLEDIYKAGEGVNSVCEDGTPNDETYYNYLVDKIYETISLAKRLSAEDKLIGRNIEDGSPRKNLLYHVNLFYNNLMTKFYNVENGRARRGLAPSNKALGLIGEVSKRVGSMFDTIKGMAKVSSNVDFTTTVASLNDLTGKND